MHGAGKINMHVPLALTQQIVKHASPAQLLEWLFESPPTLQSAMRVYWKQYTNVDGLQDLLRQRKNTDLAWWAGQQGSRTWLDYFVRNAETKLAAACSVVCRKDVDLLRHVIDEYDLAETIDSTHLLYHAIASGDHVWAQRVYELTELFSVQTEPDVPRALQALPNNEASPELLEWLTDAVPGYREHVCLMAAALDQLNVIQYVLSEYHDDDDIDWNSVLLAALGADELTVAMHLIDEEDLSLEVVFPETLNSSTKVDNAFLLGLTFSERVYKDIAMYGRPETLPELAEHGYTGTPKNLRAIARARNTPLLLAMAQRGLCSNADLLDVGLRHTMLTVVAYALGRGAVLPDTTNRMRVNLATVTDMIEEAQDTDANSLLATGIDENKPLLVAYALGRGARWKPEQIQATQNHTIRALLGSP